MQIQRPEALPRIQRVRQELQPRRIYRLDAYGAVGQVEAAEVVGVLEEARDDLPEPQSDYGKVIPPQPQGGRADNHAAQPREGRGDEEEDPEGDVYPGRVLASDRGRGGPEREAHLPEVAGGEPPDGVGAQGVERHEAQVQEPVPPQQGHAATPRPPAPPSGPRGGPWA